MKTTTPDAPDFQAGLHRLEARLRQAEQTADPAALASLREVVQALLDLHAAGLERLLDHVAAAGPAGDAILDACGADDRVGGLLLLHGLHPLPVEDRVRQALGRVRPMLRAKGGSVELLDVEDGVVRVRVALGHACPSSAAGLRQAVEEAVLAAAPDAAGLEFETEDEDATTANGIHRMPLPVL
jgi:Fe-S cluster biogenesis protein NfuA